MSALTWEVQGRAFECPDCSTRVRPDEGRYSGETIVSGGPAGDRIMPIHFCASCGVTRHSEAEQDRLKKAGAPGFRTADQVGNPLPAPPSKGALPPPEPATPVRDDGPSTPTPPGADEAGEVRLIQGRSHATTTLRNQYGRVEISLGSYSQEGEDDDHLLTRVRELTRRHFLNEIDRSEGRT